MIPQNLRQNIFPLIADVTDDVAAILHHDCGVDFQFEVSPLTADPYSVTKSHIRSWRSKIEDVAQIAGHNCFSYNTLAAEPAGVYHDDDGNTFALLFAPATFLEHNGVDGKPVLLVISEADCILTGDRSTIGMELIHRHLPKSLASKIVTIDSKWKSWVAYTDG